ncbi:hypothetical protein [Neorhizobium sp. T7_12]|uniref:hypothetical protein n=1 Tax=Neorhizobium sp. T7_12 TaxID=2093832 RepID=UPI000CF874E3|nr:hypothetical protein [Neorhizobium sp. T7_12]
MAGLQCTSGHRKEARERAEKLAQDRIEAFNQAYNALSDRYFVFLSALAQYPHIGVQPPWTEAPNSLSAEDQARRSVLYDMVISLCEEAYLIKERADDIKLHQWPGWEDYIVALLRHDEFRDYLDLGRTDGGYGGFDSRFEAYLIGLIAERKIGTPIAAAA